MKRIVNLSRGKGALMRRMQAQRLSPETQTRLDTLFSKNALGWAQIAELVSLLEANPRGEAA
jgi:hypothetical protein